MKTLDEVFEERLKIRKMSSSQLITTFEQLIRKGAGVDSVPFIWYKDEILSRCVASKML